ncbi:hypothetical protein GCM10012284_04400 [Mangrovihabitans endophyticus]|uniref:Uncharacterized protein n=1 Tax=Mangrovihabitans endophyticus TaxID=1751298 RepID=A0A8J3FLN7_9ACTN|nr:hypothetical protein GCM10012284_04400 [Mangrovihabitans endophyticus]
MDRAFAGRAGSGCHATTARVRRGHRAPGPAVHRPARTPSFRTRAVAAGAGPAAVFTRHDRLFPGWHAGHLEKTRAGCHETRGAANRTGRTRSAGAAGPRR